MWSIQEEGSEFKRPRRPRSPAVVRVQAKILRSRQTYTEAKLWQLIRGGAVGGMKFRRQAPIGPFIVDFVCLSRRVIVEIDGAVHDSPVYDQERAARREAWLVAQGFRILRLKARQVEERQADIIEALLRLGRIPH